MSVWIRPIAFLCALALAFPAQARNLAFVLGNDTYSQVPALAKARADSDGYAAFFAQQGFQVHHHKDLTYRETLVAFAQFLDEITPGDTVVFAFSGHGWSNGSENFLVPTDIRRGGSQTLIEKESFVLRNGANGVLDEIARRGPKLTVAIIDACRDNPFVTQSGTRSIGVTRGLVQVQAPSGMFVAYSAGEGQTALDRLSDADSAPYSVFTRSFLEELQKPQDLQAAFKATQTAVNDLARTIGHAQRPAYYDEVVGSACLTTQCATGGAQPAAPVSAPDARPLGAAVEWQDFRNSNSVAALQLFMSRHPGTAYAALAQERIEALKAAQAPPPRAQEPAPIAPVIKSTPSARPGWCPNAATLTERAICNSPTLSAQDITLSALYAAQRQRLTSAGFANLRSSQRVWLAQRNRCGADVACLAGAYAIRIEQLR